MKQILRLLICFFLVSAAVQAIPPRRQFPIVRQQPDGSRIILLRHGGCDAALYATQDGKAVCLAPDGSYRYAVRTDAGLEPSDVMVHELAQRDEAERLFASSRALPYAQVFSQQTSARMPLLRAAALNADGLGTYGQSARGAVSSIGVHRIPVLFVEFKDVKFQDYTTLEKVQRQLTEKGYSDEELSKGSARDYFLAQSQGMFDPQFEVLGRVAVSRERDYYGENSATSNNKYISQFVKEALDSAVAHGIDLTPYVEPSKSGVPLVSIVYAGRGEATSYETGCENYIWPHYKTLSYVPKNASYNVRSYFVGNELMCDYEGVYEEIDGKRQLVDIIPVEGTDRMMGIGIFVHEFGHALGLPDFYCTNYSHTETGMGGLSIMDYGGYLYDTYRPLGYDAYERNYMGWLRLTELTQPGTYNLYAFGNENEDETAYIIRNGQNNKEYFILENRQPTDFTPKGYGTGLFIVHVDYDATLWSQNVLNNDASHLRMTYIPADNGKEYDYNVTGAEFRGSFYPYKYTGKDSGGNSVAMCNDSLTQNSVPSDQVFKGEHMYKPIYNISLSDDGVVTFDFIERSVQPEPTALHTPTAGTRRSDALYDLQGRKVQKTTSGVYILNGRKILK